MVFVERKKLLRMGSKFDELVSRITQIGLEHHAADDSRKLAPQCAALSGERFVMWSQIHDPASWSAQGQAYTAKDTPRLPVSHEELFASWQPTARTSNASKPE
jgi:hypothetical protein